MFTNQPHEAAVVWSRLVFRIFSFTSRFLQQSSVTVHFFSYKPIGFGPSSRSYRSPDDEKCCFTGCHLFTKQQKLAQNSGDALSLGR